MTLTPPPDDDNRPSSRAQQTSADPRTRNPDETAREHVANALQILGFAGGSLTGEALDDLTARLRAALAVLDAPGAAAGDVARTIGKLATSTHALPPAMDLMTAAGILRIERIEIDPRRLAAYGYARCEHAGCLGGIVRLGEPCSWCGTIAPAVAA